MNTKAVASVDAAELIAWSVEVDDPGELLTWLPAGKAYGFLRGGDGIVGWGEAARLATRDPAEVSAALAAITARDDVGLPGCGPVAIVSLGFDPAVDASVVVVPQVVLGRREGRSWVTLVNPPGAVAVPALRRRPVAAATAPAAKLAAAVPSEDEWAHLVKQAVTAIGNGSLQKVVLARALDVTAPSVLDPRAVAARLAARFPSCFTFVCDGLVGASPELLVRRLGRHAESVVLAGTVRRGGDAEEDAALERELLGSTKDAREHQLAADSVRDVFAAVAADMVSDGAPQLLRLANVTHLATHFEAWLGTEPPSALELAARLHPTAAVGGTPREAALAMITELEAAPRGRYAGPVGWVDARGDGEFAIALRCAQLSGDTARLWAGAGIVAESDPGAEVAETTAKFDAVLSALL
ncbi:MAG TPA: isochorismate synthase [Mycobacteriales bacterium]|nr:isochorismate synthase [Mycobacteriales bacterium]